MTTNDLFTHDNRLFRMVQAGDWSGVEEAPVPNTNAAPAHRWYGGRISDKLWREVLAFLEWSYKETKSEAIVNLFYHETTRQWAALALPQKGYTGMTAELMPEHPDTTPTFARLGAGWEQFGTVHHHCSAAAFQSGTDSADERTKEGLHITIGNLGRSSGYSIHARTSFRRQMFDAVLNDWFEFPGVTLSDLPVEMSQRVLEYKLTRPNHPDHAFPDWWKANVIRVAPPLRQTPYVDPRKPVGMRDEFGMPFSSFDMPERTPSPRLDPLGHSKDDRTSIEQMEFTSELNRLREVWGVDFDALRASLHDLDQMQEELVWSAMACGVGLDDALAHLDELADDERVAQLEAERLEDAGHYGLE